ncbi:MAG: aldo/keto reductase [candidate division Zixibacteria bacterium]|nr:aldo/keto reductase [candidate division Zixibacteria bacterium]
MKVAPLVFGGNVFGWTIDEPTSFKLLDAFVDAGFNLIDTADVYSNWKPGNKGGESETIIGNWMKARRNRDKVIIATKVGYKMGWRKEGLSKRRVLKAVEASLTRLRTDYIDLYQSHVDDAATPLEKTLEGYAKLIAQGKVRVIGASNYTAARLTEALDISKKLGLPRYETLQPVYNLYDREVFDGPLEKVCVENNIGVINYFSLASGFLSGKYRGRDDLIKSARSYRVEKYLNERGFRILEAVDKVSKETHTVHACVAIAWLLAHPSITAPIASATSLGQLNDLIKGTRLVLSVEQVEELRKAGE